MFIVFTGTHSTGKTTMLDKLKEVYSPLGFTFHNSVTRYAESKGIKINKEVSDADQLFMIKLYEDYEKNNLLSGDNIMDRCLIDTLGYSQYFYNKGLISKDTLDYIHKSMVFRLKMYDIVFYFPIEFNNILDGTRVDDDEFRISVDNNIQKILKINNIKYIIVKGNIEERFKIMREEIDKVRNKRCN